LSAGVFVLNSITVSPRYLSTSLFTYLINQGNLDVKGSQDFEDEIQIIADFETRKRAVFRNVESNVR
jgi:hypothetical protein